MMKRLLVALLALCVTACTAATQNLTCGPWQVNVGERSNLFSLKYKDKTVVDYTHFAAYKPHYKGVKFILTGTPTLADNTLTWTKTGKGVSATLKLTVTQQRVIMDFNSTIQEQGPAELDIGIPISQFKVGDATHTTVDGKPLAFGPRKASDRVIRKLGLQMPDYELVFDNETTGHNHFLLQDRRKPNSDLVRYISGLRFEPNQPIHVTVTLKANTFDKITARRRELTMSRPTEILKQVKVINPAFEKGFYTWNPPKNAAIDFKVKHDGKAAAKLVVNDIHNDGVYITRKVPIIPGAKYIGKIMLKTQDVVAAVGKFSSVGAGMIIEWSDKKGQWIAAGVYGCNVFGTNDWKVVECKDLRAPDNAGFAEVFLTLRGQGTAWFDDFSLTQVITPIDKVAPAPDQPLNTNVPLFAWMPQVGNVQNFLTIAPSKDFNPKETRTYTINSESEFQLPTPLPPGTWYWKLSTPGSPDPQPWSFTHNVPVTQDCLPPTIDFMAQRIIDSKQPLVVPVKDNRNQRPKVTITIGDKTYTAAEVKGANRSFQAIFTPQQGWPKGFSTLKINAADPAGNIATKTAWLLNTPKPQNPVVIDQMGRYSTNGKPFFPIGLYEVAPKYMQEIRDIGFDAVHSYRWEGSRDNVGTRKYLDDCWNANQLRAFIGFERKAICHGELKVLAEKVGALADHPGLFCWYLFDEPEIPKQYVSPKLLTLCADLIRKLDPYHAVVMTTWGKGMNNYRRTWDTHWSQAYFTPAGVIELLDEHRKLLLNQSPMTLLVHCYDRQQSAAYRSGGKVDLNNFKPDYPWLRCAAFAGITQNVNGLWYWWFARYNKQFLNASSYPDKWANVVKVIKELKSYQPFLDAVPTPNNNGRLQVGKNLVVWCFKETDTQRLVIIANTGETPATFTLKINEQFPVFNMTLEKYGVFLKVFPK